ncbi:Drug/metabolite transporter [Macleaya cordata]|uniref:Drug/metabolite transporter n=1 Tax=Macleaya cordata TaxID=56857 RepID=A0A200PU39_MACCD|nr:Drug/metabolite transporter [Macleaya cordata]
MASPSTWRWSWKTTSDSSLTVSSSSCCPSTFSFSLYKRNRSSRTTPYRTKFSLDQNSSSSSSEVHTSYTTGNKVLKKNKSIQVGKPVDSNSLLIGVEDFPDSNNNKSTTLILEEKIMKNDKLRIRFKSLFGKRPLWKRILFASKKVRSIILLNVVALIYASNIPVLKEVEAVTDPATFTVVRFALSAIPFVPFVLRASGDVQTRTAGIELGFWVSLGYLMQALGLLTSDAGRASFISLFTVIIVPLLDGMLGAEVPALTWFGALMSVVGVTMLESSGSPPSDLVVNSLITELNIFARSTKRENFLPLLGYEVCVVAMFSIIWYFMGDWFGGTHEWDPGSWTWIMVWDWMVKFPWIPAIYTGIFSTGVCLWVEMTAMRDVSATETAIIYGLEPLWGAGFAWFLLGERWGITGWIGAAFVLGGSLTVQIFGSSSPSKSKEKKDDSEQRDNLLISDKLKGFSASPVVVTTRKKNVSDLLKK